MILISHRGNTNGARARENHPDVVKQVLDENPDMFVEVDVRKVRKVGKNFYLGHDLPEYTINLDFLMHPRIVCHAKNHLALFTLKEAGAHVFWHGEDDYTITSRGWIWAYPGNKTDKNTIIVSNTFFSGQYNDENCLGVCSDYVQEYQAHNL